MTGTLELPRLRTEYARARQSGKSGPGHQDSDGGADVRAGRRQQQSMSATLCPVTPMSASSMAARSVVTGVRDMPRNMGDGLTDVNAI